jgi:hypothetical protein
MVPGEQIAPRTVPELGRALGRADDVGEEDSREDAVRHRRVFPAAEEALDLRRRLVGGPRAEVVAWDLDSPSTRDQLGNAQRRVAPARSIEHQGRDANRRQDIGDVGVVQHAKERRGGPGVCRKPQVVDVPAQEAGSPTSDGYAVRANSSASSRVPQRSRASSPELSASETSAGEACG